MIKTIYIYFILFVTLMMTIGGSVSAFMAAADIVSPPPYYQTFDQYKSSYPMSAKSDIQVPTTSVITTTTLSEAELRKQYDQMVLDQNSINRNNATNRLIKSFGWIIIPLPIFLFFQRRIGKHPIQ